MEKRLSLILAVFFCLCFDIFSQTPTQENLIRMPLWAEREAYPGVNWDADTSTATQDFSENPFALPVSRLKKTAPFFIEGMLYGWNFVYTPSDKARGVQEYFEFTPIKKISDQEIKQIRYVKAWIEQDRLYCWVEFDRSEVQKMLFKSWQSITIPKVQGAGYAKLSEGFEGIQNASADALKNSIREYWRKQISNKPKEISGRVLLCEPPVLGIDSGRYKVTLDFFMETDRIMEYEMF